MSPASVPPPRVARAAEKAGLGYFRHRHARRTPAWRLFAELALLVPPLILLFTSEIGRPDGAWGWLAVPVGLLAEGVGYWRLSPLLSRDDLLPASPLARDVGKLSLYTALLGGYLAWQWRLGWPDNSFGDWLTVVAVASAVLVLSIGFDVLFLAYAPWYTFSGGLLIGDSWGGRRRVVRYADVKTLRYAEWSQSRLVGWLERLNISLSPDPYRAQRHWHRLRVRRGRGLRFISTTVGSAYDNLSPQICGGVVAAQLPGVLTTIGEGGKVSFGPITADRHCVRAGSVSVRWEKVSHIGYGERKLTVHTTDGSGGLALRARRVPNGETLGALHRKLREEREQDRRKQK
ncbi:hypothetical protein ACIRQQ_39060 [Streptomyces fuscichromogenes]|uniref:hypothetical protein n=1 Tax=Streptomyces fuscichromogenes TaxID=1324013 RepID=UPI0037F597A4